MSFEERLKKAIIEHPIQMDIKTIPDRIELKILKEEWKLDAQKKECLYLTFETKDKQQLVQKYGFSAFEEVQKSFALAGGIEALKNSFHTYEKRKVGRAFFDRLYPLESKKGKT